MKKYCFTDEKIEVDGHTLHRIKALVPIQEFAVKIGQLGGWIESEDNLSHNGKAWVDEEGKVYGDARVEGNTIVCGYARVYGQATLCGNKPGNLMVAGSAEVYGRAEIRGQVDVTDSARVFGNARIHGFGLNRLQALSIYGDSCLSEGSCIGT